jgi:hypothetical protein
VVSALQRAIVEVKQRWSVIGWMTKNVIYRVPPCFRKHFKPLIPAAFAVANTHQSALGTRGGLWPVFLIHMEDLCHSSSNNSLLMMITYQAVVYTFRGLVLVTNPKTDVA